MKLSESDLAPLFGGLTNSRVGVKGVINYLREALRSKEVLSNQLRERKETSGKRHSELQFGSSASVELRVEVLQKFEVLSLASSLSLVNAVFCGEHEFIPSRGISCSNYTNPIKEFYEDCFW